MNAHAVFGCDYGVMNDPLQKCLRPRLSTALSFLLDLLCISDGMGLRLLAMLHSVGPLWPISPKLNFLLCRRGTVLAP